MTLEPFSGVEPFPTHHCITGSVRRIYEAHGVSLSEDMILGIGSGVGFSYWHFKGTDPFLGGRANIERPGVEGLEKTVGRRTGVEVAVQRTSSAKKAQAGLLELLERDEPAMVYVDMGFLPYLGLPEDYHFGAHTIAVVGYDAEREVVLVGDRDDAFHELTLEDLERARGSKHKPFPPAHARYDFTFVDPHAPNAHEVWESISDCVEGMLSPPIKNIGVAGIRKAAGQVRKWPDLMDDEALRRTCFTTSIFIDANGGTGGGIFRYMYGRFLREAADITGEQELAVMADDFAAAGDKWEEIADTFRQAAESQDIEDAVDDAADQLTAIADVEQSLWTRLAEQIP